GERRRDEAAEERSRGGPPPANTVETGIRLDDHALWREVIDNREASRFELTLDGALSVLEYERLRQSLVLLHTEVAPALRGRHIADALAKAAIESAHAAGLQIVARCPFVQAYLRRHPSTTAVDVAARDKESLKET